MGAWGLGTELGCGDQVRHHQPKDLDTITEGRVKREETPGMPAGRPG